jgi:hypothetical protein
MRNIIPLFVSLFFSMLKLTAQDTATIYTKAPVTITETATLRPHLYKAAITMATGASLVTGYLSSISDSSLYVTKSWLSLKKSNTVSNFEKIDFKNIAQVRLKRDGSAGRGAIIGSAAGLAAGAIFGLVTYVEPKDDVDIFIHALFGVNRTTSTVAYGLLGGLSGAAVGTLVGALAHKTFIIGGSKEKFQQMKSELLH